METNYISQRWSILVELKKHNFPLSVRSSAIKIYNRIIFGMGMYQISDEDSALLSIMMACKCEDIQGVNVDNLFRGLTHERKLQLVQHENMLLNCIGFELHYNSPYTKVYAILIMLQEKGVLVVQNEQKDREIDETDNELWYLDGKTLVINDLDAIWEKAIENIDYILCLDRKNWSEFEIAYSALEFPIEIFKSLPFEYSANSVNYLKLSFLRVKNYVSILKVNCN